MIVKLLIGVAALLLLGPLAVALHRCAQRNSAIYGASLLISSMLCAAAVSHLIGIADPASSTVLPLGLPWLGAHFRIDALSAFFLIVINLGGAATSLFALGYGRHEEFPARVLPFFPAYLAGMNLVVLADDAFSFLVAWEFMSLTSWALVIAHHNDRENLRAGLVYLVMASIGTLALLLAFGALAGRDGGYAFEAIRAAPPSATLAALVFCLALFGAGSKAGLVPLHAWLPLAHPAAPSHVSALMSGVMTKVAVYAFVRIAFDLVGEPDWWWGMLVLALGSGTAVIGILYAMLQPDLKKLLAYSTVENIGVVFAGLGLALAFKASGLPSAAALAATAALLHVFNHATFKSLLFFGAGAVLNATGERNIENLGGLINRMPMTAFAVLVGCLAISALPPLNGFVSEWLMFQAILLSPQLPQWSLKLMVPAGGALLALSAALAAACFVRAYGVSYLGRPRSEAARSAAEVDAPSRAAMFLLAAVCLLVGVFSGAVIDALEPIVTGVVGGRMPVQGTDRLFTIVPVAESRSSYNGLLVFVFITFSTLAAIEIIHRFASRAVRRGPAWDCGYPDPSPATQYTADSFAEPIRRVFAPMFGASERVEMPRPGDPRPARLTVTVRDWIWETLYQPVASVVAGAADLLNYLQFLTIRKYLSLVFVALVLLLLRVSLWP
ncbi:MAG TPA: hydrogenase 4 subunit B [Xanthobacteraceae bacterium]|nr:hydrogenase 4 subunit B [Xanthobacteraceae bacterium]